MPTEALVIEAMKPMPRRGLLGRCSHRTPARPLHRGMNPPSPRRTCGRRCATTGKPCGRSPSIGAASPAPPRSGHAMACHSSDSLHLAGSCRPIATTGALLHLRTPTDPCRRRTRLRGGGGPLRLTRLDPGGSGGGELVGEQCSKRVLGHIVGSERTAPGARPAGRVTDDPKAAEPRGTPLPPRQHGDVDADRGPEVNQAQRHNEALQQVRPWRRVSLGGVEKWGKVGGVQFNETISARCDPKHVRGEPLSPGLEKWL